MKNKILIKFIGTIIVLLSALTLFIGCGESKDDKNSVSLECTIMTNADVITYPKSNPNYKYTITLNNERRSYADAFYYPYDYFLLDFKLVIIDSVGEKNIVNLKDVYEEWGIDIKYTHTSNGHEGIASYPPVLNDVYNNTLNTEYFRLSDNYGLHNLRISIPSLENVTDKENNPIEFDLHFIFLNDSREDVDVTLESNAETSVTKNDSSFLDFYLIDGYNFEINITDKEIEDDNKTVAYKFALEEGVNGTGYIDSILWKRDSNYIVSDIVDYKENLKGLYLLRISYYGNSLYKTKVYYCYVYFI